MFTRFSFVVLVALLSLSHIVLASASQANEEIAKNLDLFLRAAHVSSSASLALNDCSALKVMAEARDAESARWQNRARDFYQLHCSASDKSQSSPQEDQALSDKTADPIWDGSALCKTTDQRLIHCEHRGENGRGLLAYAGRDFPENSPTLVCVHFETTYRNPFEYDQQIAARCVVTEFDWRYEGQRSDVYGIKNWLYQKTPQAPSQIPDALKSQCAEVFPDAIYCTPTLIVFPESDPTRVSTCQLNTHDKVFGLGIILRIGSWNSRWVCESRSLLIPDKDKRLSIEDRQCVPDHLGQQQTPYCRFPYLPVARKPVRTFIEMQ